MKNLTALLLALLSAVSFAQPTKPVAETFLRTESRRVPLLRLLEGNPPAPIELKIERPVLVHFWATWCAPCLDELPQLVKSSSELKKAGIDLILISVDSSAATNDNKLVLSVAARRLIRMAILVAENAARGNFPSNKPFPEAMLEHYQRKAGRPVGSRGPKRKRTG